MMSIISLMIYGSCARGDNTSNSDVDILALHDEDYYKINAYNKVNIVYYGEELLKKRMAEGNLFCLHLVKEGKITYDFNNTLSGIIKQFKYKKEYRTEIKEASDLGWVLLKFAKRFDNYFYLNKKLAWCLRTIIIAQSAETRSPAFSLPAMINYVNDKSIASIINAKSESKFMKENLNKMGAILRKWNLYKPKWLEGLENIKSAQKYFEKDTYAYFITRTFEETGYSR